MELPLSPTLADMALSQFQDEEIFSSDFQIWFCFRYVDDISEDKV